MAKLRGSVRLQGKLLSGCGGISGIGSLVNFQFWADVLPLADEQVKNIRMLDDVVQESPNISYPRDADHPASDAASYRAYLDRSKARKGRSIEHARQMVKLGLLTKAQSEFVTYRDATKKLRLRAFYDAELRELPGLTSDQKKELKRIVRTVPDTSMLVTGKWKAAQQQLDAAIAEPLSPDQRAVWSRVVARRTSPGKPTLPARGSVQHSDVCMKIPDDSPVLRALVVQRGQHFFLSRYQKRLLDDLIEITRDGLSWISSDAAASGDEVVDPATIEKCKQFVEHAEQLALTGILTERPGTARASGS